MPERALLLCVFLLVVTATPGVVEGAALDGQHDDGPIHFDHQLENVKEHLHKQWILQPIADPIKTFILQITHEQWDFIAKVFNGEIDLVESASYMAEGDFNSSKDFIKFLEDQAIVLAIFGVALLSALIIPLVGCCFCCCRCCCGRCGGELTVNDARKQSLCCAVVLGIFLFIVITTILFGGSLTFMSGIHMRYTVDYVGDVTESTIEDVVDYTGELVQDLEKVAVDDLNDLIDTIITEVDGNAIVEHLLEDMDPRFSNVMDNLKLLDEDVSSIRSVVDGIITSLLDITVLADDTETELSQMRTTLATLKASCVGDHCDELPDQTVLPDNLNITSQIPDIEAETPFLADTENLNISAIIEAGFESMDGASSNIQENIADTIQDIEQTLRSVAVDVEDMLEVDISEPLMDVQHDLRDVVVDVQTFREDMDPYVKYAKYGFDGLAAITLLVALLSFLGVTCGTVGCKVDPAPENRSQMAHCSSYLLSCSVCSSFLMIIIFCLLGAIMFMLGSVNTMICTGFDEDLTIFDEVIDNPEMVNSKSFLEGLFENEGDVPTGKEVLLKCHDGETLYSTLNLDNLFDVRDMVNISQEMDAINMDEVYSAAQSSISSTVVIEGSTRQDILDVTTASHPPIDASSLLQPVWDIMNATDLMNAAQLMYEAASLAAINGTAADEEKYQDLGDQCMQLLNGPVHHILDTLSQLENSIDGLNSDKNTTLSKLAEIVVYVDILQDYLQNSAANATAQVIDDQLAMINCHGEDFVDHVDKAMREDIGQCQLVWEVYDSFVDILCVHVVDFINVIWLAMLLVAFALVINIILATKLIKYFRIPADAKHYQYQARVTKKTKTATEMQEIIVQTAKPQTSYHAVTPSDVKKYRAR